MMHEQRRYDVFLSHNSRDKPAVEVLAVRLSNDELEVFLDRWCLTPGKPWQTELKEALDRSEKVVVFIGSGSTGPWHHKEMQLALQAKEDGQVIPVLLPDGDKSNVPEFLTLLTWVNLAEGEIAYQRLVGAIKNEQLAAPLYERPARRKRRLVALFVLILFAIGSLALLPLMLPSETVANRLERLDLTIVRDHDGGPVTNATVKKSHSVVARGERQFLQYELINPIRKKDVIRLRGEFAAPAHWYCLLIDAKGDLFVTGQADAPSRVFWSDTTEERGYYGLKSPPSGGNILLVLLGDGPALESIIKENLIGIAPPPVYIEEELGPNGRVIGDPTFRDYLLLLEAKLRERLAIVSWVHLRNE